MRIKGFRGQIRLLGGRSDHGWKKHGPSEALRGISEQAAAALSPSSSSPNTAAEVNPCTMREFLFCFLRLGTFGFGGPIALAGHMQRDLVEQRRWISKQDYLEGLALSQLSPGPLAAQLAMYLGWVRGGRLGSTLVAGAFILPSLLMVLLVAWLYVRFQGLPWIQEAFYGVGAAVIAIIARSALKLGRMTVAKDPLLIAILTASALLTAWTEKEILWVFLGFGALALIARTWRSKPATTSMLAVGPWLSWLTAGMHGPAAGELWRITWYFTEAGAFVFGSGLAIVPFLHGGVVNEFHWLNERQFLDAVAVAMITPGPVVITVAFIGFLVAGFAGSVMAAIGIFLPVYFFTIVPAPWFKRHRNNPQLKAFVDGATAAATGAITGAVIVLGMRAITDVPTAVIGLVSLAILWRYKITEPVIVTAAGIIGLILWPLVHGA